MSELNDRIRDVLGRIQLAQLATVTEEGRPWTRYVMIQGSEDLTIRCATFLEARKVGQIRANPEVHLCCGVTNPMDQTPYCQIEGAASILTDAGEKEAFWNPTLAPVFSGPDDPNYAVIAVRPRRIELWSPPAMEPEVLELGE